MNTPNKTTTSLNSSVPKVEQELQEQHVHGPNCNHSHQHQALRPQIRQAPKVGRNDPCVCGSQKKFKKCCGL
ncbi:MAG: SEC-C metal-binding domain-containing protein [Bacteriovorax sp.]|nr:SEC-C metal-binding domain-containing protein [Bacteriovorax sp.]